MKAHITRRQIARPTSGLVHSSRNDSTVLYQLTSHDIVRLPLSGQRIPATLWWDQRATLDELRESADTV